MNLSLEEENRIRRYLLGDLAEAERQQVEERLLREDDFVDQLLMIEEELIDEYALGMLNANESLLYMEKFLVTPERREKFAIAKRITEYTAAKLTERGASSAQATMMRFEKTVSDLDSRESQSNQTERWREWAARLFRPSWKVAAPVLLLLGLGMGALFLLRGGLDNEKEMEALNQAYRRGRPFAARITGLSYAPYQFAQQRRGGEGGVKNEEVDGQRKVDQIALERAKSLLFGRASSARSLTILHTLGRYYLLQRDFAQAIEQLQLALTLAPDDARLQSDLGAAYLGRIEQDRAATSGRDRKDLNEALVHFNRALEIDPQLLEALYNRTLLYQSERLRREAREDWIRYRSLDPQSPWTAEALENQREVEQEINQIAPQSDRFYQDFLTAEKARNEGEALEKFGRSYTYNGNFIIAKLVDSFIDDKLNGRQKEAAEKLNALTWIGRLSEEKTGDRYTAELARYYERANAKQLDLARQARETMSAAYQLYRQSRNDQAIEKYDQARQLFERAGDAAEALFSEAWIGHCHHQRSDTESNLQIFTRLRPILMEKKYLWMAANAYCGLANGHNSAGQFSQAFDDCLKCGEYSDRVGDKVGLIRSLNIRGGFYHDLGKQDEALRISQQGMDFSDEYGAGNDYAIAFYQISSRSLSALGLFEAARAFQLEAVKMAEETKSPRLRARAQIHLGLIFGKWKKYDLAIAGIQRGIAIGRGLGTDETGQEFMHYGLLHLGNVYREAGMFDQALSSFNQVADYYHRSKRQIYAYAGSKGRLLTFIARGDDQSAQAELNRVVALYEQYRKNIQEESNRNRFFDQEQGIYDVAIDFAYTRLKDPKQALNYSELSRGRSLLDAIRRGWKSVEGPEAPDLKIARGATPDGPDEIRRQTPSQVQLVEYAVLEDKLLIWLIDKAGIESRSIPISRRELSDRVKSYLDLINQPAVTGPETANQHWKDASAELYDLLVRPIEARLDKQKQICFIPDKILNLAPFGTLVSRETGKLMIEEYLLLSAPSANIFLDSTEKARLKSGVRDERLAAVGDPRFASDDFPSLSRLPTAGREARAIANFYRSSILLTEEHARKGPLLQAMENADVVHLALHYVPDPWSPMLSRIPLASNLSGERAQDREGALQMYELYQIQSFHPRLVVLSACQTAVESYLGGEGAIGIARPFEAAGVPLVVASLWPVETVATADLMVAFHRARKQQGLSTVQALKNAQLAMYHRQDRLRHPFYWAAFIAVGGLSDY